MVVLGVKEKTMMLPIPLRPTNELLQYAICIRLVFVQIIIIGTSYIANSNLKESEKNLKPRKKV